MNTPSPKFFCPRCSKAYGQDFKYCGHCGADMHHASGLSFAAQGRPDSESDGSDSDSGDFEVRADPDYKRTDDLRAVRAREGRRATEDMRALMDESGHIPTMNRRGRDRWLGRVVDSRYKVIEVIGSGGMGVVYKVEHQRMGKVAAMKVLHQELAEEDEVKLRFHREAEAVSKLTHPNTVQVFDFGSELGALYLIMEYVRGPDLGSLIKRDGPLPFLRAAPLLGQICAALAEAHEQGIIHRDLKPENVLVTRTHGGRDFVKVLDFGLAKLTERDGEPGVTDRGLIVGTPYYMSPEQIRGEDEIDNRSDIYSLGALMYKVVTGEPPFKAKTPVGVLTKHLTADVEPPSRRRPDLLIPPPVDALLLKALAKDPEDRYSDISELIAALEDVYVEVCGDSSPVGLPAMSGPLRLSGSGSSAGSAPAVRSDSGEESDDLEDDVDYGIDSAMRLRRSDLDLFEQAMKRRRLLSLGLIPLLLAAGAAAIVYLFVLREEPARTSEHESNDEIQNATLISTGSKVSGHIGKRMSPRQPDRDFYRLKQTADPDRSQVANVSVTGLPNMDLEVRLLDGSGRELAKANEGGVGHGENIRLRKVTGKLLVMVTQVSPPGPRLPIENVSDAYTLMVTLEPINQRAVEPNDSSADAIDIPVSRSIQGFMDGRDDVDTFKFDGAAGKYALSIEGADGAPLVWTITGGKPRTQRRATVALTPGTIIRLERGDAKRPAGEKLPGADAAYTLAIRPL